MSAFEIGLLSFPALLVMIFLPQGLLPSIARRLKGRNE